MSSCKLGFTLMIHNSRFHIDWDFLAIFGEPLGLHVLGFSPRRNTEAILLERLFCSWAKQRYNFVKLFFCPNKDGGQSVFELLVVLCRSCQFKLRPEIHVHYKPCHFDIVLVLHHYINIFIITCNLTNLNKTKKLTHQNQKWVFKNKWNFQTERERDRDRVPSESLKEETHEVLQREAS